MSQPLTLSITDAAERLGVGRTTFYGLIANGEVETIHIGSRQLVVDASLIALVDRLRMQAAA